MNKQARPSATYERPLVAASAASGPLDLRNLLDLFRKRAVLFVAVAIAVACAVVLMTLAIKPVYSATSMIEVAPLKIGPLLAEAPQGGQPPDQALVDTEVNKMRSRPVAEEVVDRLDLTRDAEFAAGSGGLRALLGGSSRPPSPGAQHTATVDRVLKKLKVAREGTTYIVDLTFLSHDAAKAALIASSFADAYLRLTRDTLGETNAKENAELKQRVDSLGAEVRGADARVAGYRAEAGISVGAVNGTITDQQVAPVSNELATASSDAAAAQSNLAAAKAQIASGGLDSVSSVLSSPTITELRKQRAEVVRNQGEIAAQYGPRHPEYIRVQRQLADIDLQLSEEQQRIVSGLESNARASAARKASLSGGLAQLKGEQASNSRRSVVADNLQKEADAKRQVLTQVLQAQTETEQRSHLDQPRSHLLSHATPSPSPAFPNPTLFSLAGVLLGVICGAAAVFVAETFDTGLGTGDEVEDALGLPLLSSIPLLGRSQLKEAGCAGSVASFVTRRPLSAFAEALRTLRSAMMLTDGASRSVVVVALTSALPDEGKTTTVVSLARVLALSGSRVLMIDGDLRRGSLSRVAQAATPVTGLLEVLRGEATVEQAVVADTTKGVDILAVRDRSPPRQDPFATEEMRTLLKTVAARYDHVLIDCPPVLAVADARTLADMADATVLLVRWGRTPRQAAAAAAMRLQRDGSRLLGAVLTNVDLRRRARLGSSDPEYYFERYHKYYQQ